MKTIVLLSLLLCAASAAPAEDKLAAPEVEDKMKNQEELVPKDSVPVPMNAQVVEQAAAAQAPFSFCPSGWFSYDSHCFLFVNNPMTWFKAEEHCNDLGGHLASVTSGRQYSFLQTIAQTAGQSVAWLGGFYLQGQWLWIDRERFYYNNWYSQASATGCPCITLRSTTGWSNVQCTSTNRFICAKSRFSC
ncbi:Ladderlectin Precursor [Channa argus]|uniref:Ladderlectin n=1 Tax=Channa argus TaxID=215402 RepID=A0A6G1PN88_CHAAH|nr:Ladderlectin Precursor [Channa argus]KAK2910477.1 hypothetical protein Q8A73_008192 [Channa argus]